MIRLAIRVARADAEIALAELLELAPAGVEEVDRGDTIEYAVYGAEGELPSLPDLRAAAGAALVDVTTTQVADDWASRWRDFHRPVTIGGRLHVRPPWTDPPPGDAELLDIVIDPNQAFGTGAHATTRLCLEALLELEPSGAFVDLGAGSGVLAIAAAKLGWAPVRPSTTSTRRSRPRARTRRSTTSRSPSPTRTFCTGAPRRRHATVVANLCVRCSRTSRAPASPARRRRCSSSAGCCAPRRTRSPPRSSATRACASSARSERGEWAALTLDGRLKSADIVDSDANSARRCC